MSKQQTHTQAESDDTDDDNDYKYYGDYIDGGDYDVVFQYCCYTLSIMHSFHKTKDQKIQQASNKNTLS